MIFREIKKKKVKVSREVFDDFFVEARIFP